MKDTTIKNNNDNEHTNIKVEPNDSINGWKKEFYQTIHASDFGVLRLRPAYRNGMLPPI